MILSQPTDWTLWFYFSFLPSSTGKGGSERTTVCCWATFHVKPQYCPESRTDHLGTLKLPPWLSEEHQKSSRSSQGAAPEVYSLQQLWKRPPVLWSCSDEPLLLWWCQQGDHCDTAVHIADYWLQPWSAAVETTALLWETQDLQVCTNARTWEQCGSVKSPGMKTVCCTALCGCTFPRSRQGREREKLRNSILCKVL